MAKNQSSIVTGLGKAYYSIKTEGGYAVPKELGDMISFAINPSENSTKLYAGDRTIAIDSATTISGTIGIPTLTNQVLCDLFGYEQKEDGSIVYSSRAVKPTVCLMLEQHNADGVDDYITLWQVKVNIGGLQGNTKTENVSFQTTEISFEVLPEEDGEWMRVISSDAEGFVKPDYTVAPKK